jgi:hypothetical protein
MKLDGERDYLFSRILIITARSITARDFLLRRRAYLWIQEPDTTLISRYDESLGVSHQAKQSAASVPRTAESTVESYPNKPLGRSLDRAPEPATKEAQQKEAGSLGDGR